jgi:uncharacterized integral membrane protein (TIGR00698 family)
MINLPKPANLVLLFLLLALVVSGYVSIGVSLIIGLVYALLFGNPIRKKTQSASGLILKASIVILGFSFNFIEIFETAKDTFLMTLITIAFALTAGLLLGRLFKVESKLSVLIAGGTAICGGSAIAALSPTIQAKSAQILVAMSVVFLLNALGLIAYPYIGEYLSLSQHEFGLWAALGIHDTSSVVGAASDYGEEALKTATTTKLARALWIIPLVFLAGLHFKSEKKSAGFPVFILYFIGASLIVSGLPLLDSNNQWSSQLLEPVAHWSKWIAKKGMAISLFFIGAGFTRETLKEVRLSALWQGVILWLLVSVFSYWIIKLM